MLTDITPRAISEQCYLNIPKSTHVDTDRGDIWDGLAHKLSNKPAWEMVNSPSTPHCVLIAGMENMGHLSGCIPRLDRPAILSGRCILYLWWVRLLGTSHTPHYHQHREQSSRHLLSTPMALYCLSNLTGLLQPATLAGAWPTSHPGTFGACPLKMAAPQA